MIEPAIEKAIEQSAERDGHPPPRGPRAARRDRRRAPVLVAPPVARALVIVDFQNDFTPPDGALAVPDGDAIAERLNELARSGDSTSSSPPATGTRPTTAPSRSRGGPWPVHCVADTPGAQLHPALDAEPGRRDRRQGPGPRHRGLLGLRGHAPRGAAARAGDRPGDRGRPGHRLLRQEHRARRAARRLQVTVDTSAVRGVDVRPRRLRARARRAPRGRGGAGLVPTPAERLAPGCWANPSPTSACWRRCARSRATCSSPRPCARRRGTTCRCRSAPGRRSPSRSSSRACASCSS